VALGTFLSAFRKLLEAAKEHGDIGGLSSSISPPSPLAMDSFTAGRFVVLCFFLEFLQH